MSRDPSYQIWRKQEAIQKENAKIKRKVQLVILEEELRILKK